MSRFIYHATNPNFSRPIQLNLREFATCQALALTKYVLHMFKILTLYNL